MSTAKTTGLSNLMALEPSLGIFPAIHQALSSALFCSALLFLRLLNLLFFFPFFLSIRNAGCGRLPGP
jgi:hypothetical protein